jgi:hypothetical protein
MLVLQNLYPYRLYASFALGLVRGSLNALGLNADVTMEFAQDALQFLITERDFDA